MISDLTLIHRFTGTNRHYVMVWDNGEHAYFRARNLREARKIAEAFTERLTNQRLLTVMRDRSSDGW